MAKVVNTGKHAIILPTGHVIRGSGELITTNDVLLCVDNAPRLNALSLSGEITIAYDPDEPAAKPAKK